MKQTLFPFKASNILNMSIEERTAHIQKSIDKLSTDGGGIVRLDEPGEYIINGLLAKPNVTLFLGDNVILKGSANEKEYFHRPGPFELLTNMTPICALIYGRNCHNFKIIGSGIIDGNYQMFISPNQENSQHIKSPKYPRPMLIYLENSDGVKLENIKLENSAFWTVHLVGCQNAEINSIVIKNEMRMPNTDGIDIDRCQNVSISNCDIRTGDDGICLKCTEETSMYGNCVNILVSDCTISSRSAAFKVGSSSFGKFLNVICENTNIFNSNRGIAFQLRDGGTAENFHFGNIKIQTEKFSREWWGNGEPIYVTFLKRFRSTRVNLDDGIKNIFFDHIQCVSDNSIFIFADSKKIFSNIFLNQVTLRINGYRNQMMKFDLRPSSLQSHVELPSEEFMTSSSYTTLNHLQIKYELDNA